VVGGLVLLMANGLELEGAVRDVEVPTQAFAQPVQHLTGAPFADARVVHDDMRGQHTYPAGDGPGVQVVDIDHATHFPDVVPYFSEVHAVHQDESWRADRLMKLDTKRVVRSDGTAGQHDRGGCGHGGVASVEGPFGASTSFGPAYIHLIRCHDSAITNLTLLCRYHHTHLLQKGWTCRINADDLPEWIPSWWIDQRSDPKSTHASGSAPAVTSATTARRRMNNRRSTLWLRADRRLPPPQCAEGQDDVHRDNQVAEHGRHCSSHTAPIVEKLTR
jgi:hypothetical protein